MIGSIWRIALLLAFFALPAGARPPDRQLQMLQRGINITAWFRYPASRDPEVLAQWMSDAAMTDLRRAGFTFVRLAIDPVIVESPAVRDVALGAICRLQQQGLAVVVSPHPVSWQIDISPLDRAGLLRFWHGFAPALRRCDTAMLMPEVVNEPVFAGDAAAWAQLQHVLLTDIRAALPHVTVVLTGADWGGIDGLTTLEPEPDDNVVYSIHVYDPQDLTALAAYRAGLDRSALARMPFPVGDRAACSALGDLTGDRPTRDMIRYYCATGWDAAMLAARIERAAAWGRRHDAVVLVGEFGAADTLNKAARLAWLRAARDGFEAAGLGWALWGYDDMMGLSVPRPPGRPILDTNVLTALGLLSVH